MSSIASMTNTNADDVTVASSDAVLDDGAVKLLRVASKAEWMASPKAAGVVYYWAGGIAIGDLLVVGS